MRDELTRCATAFIHRTDYNRKCNISAIIYKMGTQESIGRGKNWIRMENRVDSLERFVLLKKETEQWISKKEKKNQMNSSYPAVKAFWFMPTNVIACNTNCSGIIRIERIDSNTHLVHIAWVSTCRVCCVERFEQMKCNIVCDSEHMMCIGQVSIIVAYFFIEHMLRGSERRISAFFYSVCDFCITNTTVQ